MLIVFYITKRKKDMKSLTIAILLLAYLPVFSQISYKPNLQLRERLRKSTWLELKALTPQKQRLMMQMIFNSKEMFRQYEKAARQRNLAPYELPTVVSFFQIICEETKMGKELSEKQYSSRYEEVKSRFQKEKIGLDMNNEEKQRKYDVLIMKAMWLTGLYNMTNGQYAPLKPLAQKFLDENQIEAVSKSTKTISSGSNSLPRENKITQAPKRPPSSPQVSVKADAARGVKDIILRTVTNYGLNGAYIDNEVHVLYENGDMYTNPSNSLEQGNIQGLKAKYPKKWDRWKQRGNSLWVTKTRNGKTYEWKKWFKLRPATSNFRLSGTFKTADAFGGATVINASTVVFDRQGRFAWKTFKGGNTAWKPVYSNTKSAGTYTLKGYTITLSYNNGTKESFFFALYPKDNEHFIIGKSHFVPGEK